MADRATYDQRLHSKHVARVLAGMRRGLHAAASIVLALLGPNKAKDLRERSKPKARRSTLMYA